MAGFVAASLIFGAPWHLPPNWGDIPTWLAVGVATVGGGVALSQLRQQQEVIKGEFERNKDRDDLMDRQRRELQANEESRQRAQAGNVDFDLWLPQAVQVLSSPPFTPAPTVILSVENKSARPIRNIVCRIGSDDGAQPADGVGSMLQPATNRPAYQRLMNPTASQRLPMIRAGERYGFLFHSENPQDVEPHEYVTRFTDDAEVRWKLDGDMRLARVEDSNLRSLMRVVNRPEGHR
jgi:hypothetical protein